MIAIPNMDKPKSCDDCFVPLSKCEYFAKDGIDHCPLIDIVTCGECKWWSRDGKRKDGKGWCENVICGITKPNAFCSYGERRSDEHNTERD